MFPKASQNNAVLSAHLAWIVFFLSPQVVELNLLEPSVKGQQDNQSSRLTIETNEKDGSSLSGVRNQNNSQDAIDKQEPQPLVPNSGTTRLNPPISSESQRLLYEIQQLRSTQNGLSASPGNEQSERMFQDELTRLVQQQESEPLNESHPDLRLGDRAYSVPMNQQQWHNFSETNKNAMLSPLNANDQVRQDRYQNHPVNPQHGRNRFTDQMVENRYNSFQEQRSDKPQSNKPRSDKPHLDLLYSDHHPHSAQPHSDHRSLRSMAKRLDQIAADLEEAQMYGQADEIRSTAQELWKTARKKPADGMEGPRPNQMPQNRSFDEPRSDWGRRPDPKSERGSDIERRTWLGN